MPHCPDGTSEQTVKNGHISTGKQRHLHSNCGRQFTENLTYQVINTCTRELINQRLPERTFIKRSWSSGVMVSHLWG